MSTRASAAAASTDAPPIAVVRRGRRRAAVALAVLLSALVVGVAPASAERGFSPRFSENAPGNVTIAANTILSCDPALASGCAAARAGTATGTALNNNAYSMRYVDVDADPTTFSSSSAALDLPAGATVLFAGLYFGGRTTTTAPNRGSVRLRVPGAAGYQNLTGALDLSTVVAGAYQAFADVTTQVRAAGSGAYTVANVTASNAVDRYAGWALVVAYRDESQPARNLTVFDGLQSVSQGETPVSIPVSGFRTPASGPVRTRLGFVAYEGDRDAVGDRASLNDRDLSDPAHGLANFFTSAITDLGVPVTTKSPNYANQLGFEAFVSGADGFLANESTSAVIRLRTSLEQVVVGVVTFATELASPQISVAKSVANVTDPGGPARRGDVLRYTLAYRNSGGDAATGFVAGDTVPTATSYVAGSLRIASGAPGAPASPTDAVGDDLAEFVAAGGEVRFRLGARAGPALGGSLGSPGSGTDTATVTFDVVVDPTAPLGQEITNVARADFFSATLGVAETASSPPVTETVRGADLTVVKRHTGELVGGAAAPFSLTVTNSGTIATNGAVTVTDRFPAASFAAVATPAGLGWDCSASTGLLLSCTRADRLGPGAAYPPIAVTATVAGSPPAQVTNTAVVAGGGNADTSNDSSTDVGSTTTRSDLQLVKTVTPDVVLSGGRVTFELTATNGGPSTATGVTVSDPLGPGYANVTAVSTRGTCTTAVTCTLGTLPRDESATITITAEVTGNNLPAVVNTATVTRAQTDPVAANNTATATFAIANTADLALTKTAAASPAAPNPTAGQADGYRYVITVRNLGPGTAGSVVVDDPLPASFTPTAISAPGFTCNRPAAGGQLQCTRPALATADGAQTITVLGTLAADTEGQAILNQARVSAATGDPDGGNDVDGTSDVAIPSADLDIAKTGPADPVAAGDAAAFTLTVRNHGPSNATGVVVSDPLPAGLQFDSASPGCGESAGVVTCAIGAIAAGTAQTRTITVRPTAALQGQSVTNVATVAGDQPDEVAANDTGAATIEVPSPPQPAPGPPAVAPSPAPPGGGPAATGAGADLQVTKTTASRRGTLGAVLRYTVTVRNRGPLAARDVELTDTLSRPVSWSRAVTDRGRCRRARTLVCSLGTLAAGREATVRIAVRPLRTGTLRNTATATAATADPDLADNQAAVATRVTRGQTRLRVTKVAARPSVRSGADVRFKIAVSAPGPAAAVDVRVCDALPPALSVAFAPRARVRAGRPCWTVALLKPGRRAVFTVTATARTVAGSVRALNRAVVTAANARRASAGAAVRVLAPRRFPGVCGARLTRRC